MFDVAPGGVVFAKGSVETLSAIFSIASVRVSMFLVILSTRWDKAIFSAMSLLLAQSSHLHEKFGFFVEPA